MRNLAPVAAQYATLMGHPVARPCWRVRLANHGGGFADPLDVTSSVASVEIRRPLREGNRATIVLRNRNGQFDPLSGTYAAAVRAQNAQVQVDFGETIAGTAYYWRVFTGGIYSCTPTYEVPASEVTLECLDRGRDLWQYIITSPMYEPTGVTPTYWTAHQIIRDLFERFAGLSWPGDFNLDPVGDWTVLGAVQFQQEPLTPAAAKCLQPSGYRLFFDYDGDVSSALLIPAGAPGGWATAGTILDNNIDLPLDGPIDQEPVATRVRVTGGDCDHDLIVIGDHALVGTSRFAVNLPAGEEHCGGGDCYYRVPVSAAHWHLWLQGPVGEVYRGLCSEVTNLRFGMGSLANFVIAPRVIHVDPASDQMHLGMGRHVVEVEMEAKPGTWIDCEFDVEGHKFETYRPRIYCQDWDDTLITRWGELRGNVDCPTALNWVHANTIAHQEMTIAALSGKVAIVNLKRLDLRVEPGDVWTIENPQAASFKVWVRAVHHAMVPNRGKTKLEGYVIA